MTYETTSRGNTMTTLQAKYTVCQPGLRGTSTEHVVDVPVLSRVEFDGLATSRPVTRTFDCGTAAGYPIDSGLWVMPSVRHPGYEMLLKHVGHGYSRPIAYCLTVSAAVDPTTEREEPQSDDLTLLP